MGMTQSELAKRLHLSFQQVQKYERGANRVSSGRLMRRLRLISAISTASMKSEPKLAVTICFAGCWRREAALNS